MLRSSSIDLGQFLGTHQDPNLDPSLLELTVVTVLISYFYLPQPLLPLPASTLGAGLGLPAGLEGSLGPGWGGPCGGALGVVADKTSWCPHQVPWGPTSDCLFLRQVGGAGSFNLFPCTA